jgi:hypothetical protein
MKKLLFLALGLMSVHCVHATEDSWIVVSMGEDDDKLTVNGVELVSPVKIKYEDETPLTLLGAGSPDVMIAKARSSSNPALPFEVDPEDDRVTITVLNSSAHPFIRLSGSVRAKIYGVNVALGGLQNGGGAPAVEFMQDSMVGDVRFATGNYWMLGNEIKSVRKRGIGGFRPEDTATPEARSKVIRMVLSIYGLSGKFGDRIAEAAVAVENPDEFAMAFNSTNLRALSRLTDEDLLTANFSILDGEILLNGVPLPSDW